MGRGAVFQGWAWFPLTAALLILTTGGPAVQAGPPNSDGAEEAAAFLVGHWQRPLKPNGPVPAGFSDAEASLAPETCGGCHPEQFTDWKGALHSRAMGPGLLGQLQVMGAQSREDHAACLQCHAPLAEQAEHLVQSLTAGVALPPLANGASSAHGLTCAGCHVRGHIRYGPPRREGKTSGAEPPLPHGGWQVTKAFSDAKFCSACHQFEAGWHSLNGKPLENTYEEWRSSRHAREGRTCQSCHMPDRRHLWRGIHDPAMTRSGLTIATRIETDGGRIRAELTLTNTGVGHAFPTYVTPRVLVEIGQEDSDGKPIEATLERHLIARDVSLDLTRENADSRLMPDETRRYRYDQPRVGDAQALLFRVSVYPDAFYADFYRALLNDPDYGKGHGALRAALEQAEASAYALFQERRPFGARYGAGGAPR